MCKLNSEFAEYIPNQSFISIEYLLKSKEIYQNTNLTFMTIHMTTVTRALMSGSRLQVFRLHMWAQRFGKKSLFAWHGWHIQGIKRNTA